MSCRMTKPTKWPLSPAKTQISLGVCPVWSESSLSTWRNIGPLTTYWVHSEDSDQTGWMPRLIWVFAGRTVHYVGFVMRRLICFYGEICKIIPNLSSNFLYFQINHLEEALRVREEGFEDTQHSHQDQLNKLTTLTKERELSWQKQKEEIEAHYQQLLDEMQSRIKVIRPLDPTPSYPPPQLNKLRMLTKERELSWQK